MVYRVGVIGLGLMGRRMLGTIAAHESFAAVAGFDTDAAQTRAVAASHGLQACASAEALLDRKDLDLVYVATPPASHVALGLAALDRGLPLFLEKPLAADVGRATRFVEAADQKRTPAAMNFPFASLAGLPRILAELGDGTAGTVHRVEILLHFGCWPRSWHHAGPWLQGRDEGGFLREVFSHFAYLTQRALGELSVVDARVEWTDEDATQSETRVAAELLAGGVPVSLIGGVGGAAPDFNRWTLHARERSYRVEDWSRVSFADATGWQELGPDPGEAHGAGGQLDAVAAMLAGDPHSLPSLADGLGVLRVVEAMHSGRPG
jgi:predicted dehydrogenase